MRSAYTLGVVAALPLAALVAFGLSDSMSSAEPGAEPTQAQTAAPLACFAAAKDDTMLDDGQARDLCQGSQTTWPVRCYSASQDQTAMSEHNGISLCQCAKSIRPVTCYIQADYDTNLSDYEIVQMCSARALNRVFLPYCTATPPLNPGG